MKTSTLLFVAFCFYHNSSAQISKSTEDVPLVFQVSVGSLGALSLLTTIGLVSGDGGESNSDSGDQAQSDSGESQSGIQERKGQAHIQEIEDELLLFLNDASRLAVAQQGLSDLEIIDSYAENYPLLMNFYHDLVLHQPEVIYGVNMHLEGPTLIERLNVLMTAHFWGSAHP